MLEPKPQQLSTGCSLKDDSFVLIVVIMDEGFNNRERAVGDIWNFFVPTLFQWFSATVLKGESVQEFLFSFQFSRM